MSNESKEFINDLFLQLSGINSDFRHLTYESTDFEFPYVEKMAYFLKDMHDVSYDRKNAIITMSTKNGKIYSFNDIIKFNQMNQDDLEIIGVGNEVGSLTHDPGCAILKFQVNVDKHETEVKQLGYPDFEEDNSDWGLDEILMMLKNNKK